MMRKSFREGRDKKFSRRLGRKISLAQLQNLLRIIDEWPDLELEEQHQSWRFFPVNRACTWSSANELSSSAYVLTRKANPFHFLRSHGVLEVVWGHSQWTTAIALPKWINNYHCLGIFAWVCGSVLTRPLPAGVITLDSVKSSSRFLLDPLFKCTSGPPAVIW